MTEMSAGRAIVELLKAEGVRHVFGIVGSTFLDVLAEDRAGPAPEAWQGEARELRARRQSRADPGSLACPRATETA